MKLECYNEICLYEASDWGTLWWIESLRDQDRYENHIDAVIKREIKKETFKSKELEEQKIYLLNFLENEIKIRLQYYRVDEIYVALLSIKECIRRLLLREKKKLDWTIISDVATVNLLMKMTNEIAAFERRPMAELENECSNFVNAICYARRYSIVAENMELLYGRASDIEDICFGVVQTKETERYFDVYLENGVDEKPEDYVIQNKVLLEKLKQEDKTPDRIMHGLDCLLKKEFGFASSDYQLLTRNLFRMEFQSLQKFNKWIEKELPLYESYPVFAMEKELLSNLCEKDCLEELLNTFSINRNINKHKNEMELELFCFYETDKFIVFGNFDLMQTISTFEKFLISGHYIDIYKSGMSENKEIKKAQRMLSKYFSACVSDYLYACGYSLPMQKYQKESVPRAEIDKIEISGRNILVDSQNKGLGDIDVLAIDKNKKIILLIELKFYKPAITTKDMLLGDKGKFLKDEVIRHMQEREKAVIENKEDVVRFVLGEVTEGYTVKSILITARTNFYGINEANINYLTWSEFLIQAKNREL